jgi:hypothetical protein
MNWTFEHVVEATGDHSRCSDETIDKIDAFLDQWPDSEWGPAHIVLSDENVEDSDIQFCLAGIDNYRPGDCSKEFPTEELAATKAFLESLLLIPEDER